MEPKSLQESFAPQSICFGCGPANQQGLRIRSFEGPNGDYVCEWRPSKHHEAFPGVLNGGIVGALLDCHSNWSAAIHLMKKTGSEQPLCTVTSEFHVKLLRPTPTDAPIEVLAHIKESTDDRAVVEAKLIAKGKTCATCLGTFVAVRPGHPAYHRW